MKIRLKILLCLAIILAIWTFAGTIYTEMKTILFLTNIVELNKDFARDIRKWSRYYKNDWMWITSITLTETWGEKEVDSPLGKSRGAGAFQLSLNVIHDAVECHTWLKGRSHYDYELQAVGANLHIRSLKDHFVDKHKPRYVRRVDAAQIYNIGIGDWWKGKRNPRYARKQAKNYSWLKFEWRRYIRNPFKY